VTLDTLIFDPSVCGFPKPRIPVLPTGISGLSLSTTSAWAPAANFRHFTRGRYALHEAYRLAGIGPGSTLLAPAYHCRTMLDPALALGGDVVLYPLKPDLSPNLDALEDLFNNSPNPVKAILATHYFGFPQELQQLATWCTERDTTLIEDCSHALFSEQHLPPGVGRSGTFVISSPYKFLPCPDGGLLYSSHAESMSSVQTRSWSWADELRGVAAVWSIAGVQRRNRTTCDAARLSTELAAIIAQPSPAAGDYRETTGCSADYHPEENVRAALRYSRLVYRHADIAEIASRRRKNYSRWSAATMNLQHCRPLFPMLPEGCIPYMFPLYIEQPVPCFNWLKRIGVPIWRWDSIAASTCPTANDYRLHLLHLPCHQSLSEIELEWMIAGVGKVLNATS
jgi:hypothetical protein